MTQIHTVTEVFDAIRVVKAGTPRLITNFFPDQNKLQTWIHCGRLVGTTADGIAYFLRRDRDFWHFYYCAESEQALRDGLLKVTHLQRVPVVVDVVGSEECVLGVLDALQFAGFCQYNRLHRMTRATLRDPVPPQDNGVEAVYAGQSDVGAILDLLCRSFDPYAKQLPLREEIKTAVTNGQILIAHVGGALAGVLFSKTQGLTSTIRYWLVDKPFLMLGIGSALMRKYLVAQCSAERLLLWVVGTNENAIRKYQHYGFVPDGLVDHILVNKFIRL